VTESACMQIENIKTIVPNKSHWEIKSPVFYSCMFPEILQFYLIKYAYLNVCLHLQAKGKKNPHQIYCPGE
jgi:hypothetical protein